MQSNDSVNKKNWMIFNLEQYGGNYIFTFFLQYFFGIQFTYHYIYQKDKTKKNALKRIPLPT